MPTPWLVFQSIKKTKRYSRSNQDKVTGTDKSDSLVFLHPQLCYIAFTCQFCNLALCIGLFFSSSFSKICMLHVAAEIAL